MSEYPLPGDPLEKGELIELARKFAGLEITDIITDPRLSHHSFWEGEWGRGGGGRKGN